MLYRKASWIGFFSVVLTALPAWAESPAEIYARGQKLLSEGKIEAAAKEIAQAASAEPKNDKYADKAKQLRKVLELQEVLAKENDDGPWTRVARALHQFYRNEKLNEEALKLDRQIHERLNSALSAGILADTLLAMSRNDEAAQVIEDLPEKQRDLSANVVRVIALSRAGRDKDALAAADSMELPADVCAGKAYMLARMNAAVGRFDDAAKLLKKSFETAPAAKLANFKKSAKNCPDFTKMLAEERYASVWTTVSNPPVSEHEHKHDESDGRSHCLGCPSMDQVQDIPKNEKETKLNAGKK
jgi:tetratricopeptide (TPR) repeat protein